MKKQFLILISCCFFASLNAQDLHFTMFEQTPLLLNPAFAGNQPNKIRSAAIYRNQWLSVSGTNPSGSYHSLYASVDAPVLTIQKKESGRKHYLGAGLNLAYNASSSISILAPALDLAFHLSLAKNNNTYLSIGVEGAYRYSSPVEMIFVDSLGGLYTAKVDGIRGLEASPGLLFSHKGAGWGFQLSSAFRHLLNRYQVGIDTKYKQPINYINAVRANVSLGQKMTIFPMFLMQYIPIQGGNNPVYFNAQVLSAIHFNKDKTSNLLVGLGSRLRRNAFLRLGYEYKGWQLNLSYELDELQATVLWHSVEVGLTYMARLSKEA